MVDFRKSLNTQKIHRKIDPLELYESLDRRSVTGPLRPAQVNVLSQWFESRKEDRDLIVKLHTGVGKTLIGLLILQSKLNDKKEPCLYLCPNKYLADQVALDAEKFGIQYCKFDSTGHIPNEFLNSEKILIAHVQKLFNGKSKFGLNNNFVEIGNIVLDDSHACIDSIANSFTITIKKNRDAYSELFELFRDAIRNQGEGTFLEIEEGEYSSMLPIPYWSLIDKREEFLSIISKYKNEDFIKFTWPLFKDHSHNYQAFISGDHIELSPYHIPIHLYGSFNNAKQRILMSATTQDDSFFIKGFNFNLEAIKKPLTDDSRKWSGEKMVLIPSLIDEELDRNLIVTRFASYSNSKVGIVALTSSFAKANQYEKLGSKIVNANNIYESVTELKNKNFKNTFVFVNRYDGIDLPDESCRVLIIDSKPYFSSLADIYEENCRIDSDLINTKIAQKIEQGLGRSVRGEKDYSVIILTGLDLVRFIQNNRTKKFFSSQTTQQIKIGVEISQLAKNDIQEHESSMKIISDLLNQALNRDEGWKEFYKERMNEIVNKVENNSLYKTLSTEREAEELYFLGDYEKATLIMQSFIDNLPDGPTERGWYLQNLARYTYSLSKANSIKIQGSAFSNNHQLLKPIEGVSYKKLDFINHSRLKNISNWIKGFNNFKELSLEVDSVLEDFSFGSKSEKFETALKSIGEMLGFLSERPDKEYKKGPDNLWCTSGNIFFLFECKSETSRKSESISKQDAGQMNSHCGWFEEIYGDSEVKRVLIIPFNKISYAASFTHEVEIMRTSKLNLLKKNIKAFYKEFRTSRLESISEEQIQKLLETHDLTQKKLTDNYSEKYKK